MVSVKVSDRLRLCETNTYNPLSGVRSLPLKLLTTLDQRYKLCIHIFCKFLRIQNDLNTSLTRADADFVENLRCFFYISRELLFHADRGSTTSHIASQRKKFLHMDHLHFLVLGSLCHLFQVQLLIDRDTADQIAVLIAL